MTSFNAQYAPGDAEFKLGDAASYDSVVHDFDLLTNAYTAPIASQVIVMAEIGSGGTVLDVGCGTGVLTLLAARDVGPLGRVVGFDLSDGMLAKAGSLAKQAQLADRIQFVKGDAERMQFSDASFKSVISLYALRHFPDPEQALREMFRCCAPGGRTLVAVGSAPPLFSTAAIRAAYRKGLDAALRVVGRAPLRATAFLDGLIEKHLGPDGQPQHAAWTHGVQRYSATVAQLMARVGYADIRSSWLGQSTTITSVEEFWTLQVTLSSHARKRIQAASQREVSGLRAAFNTTCEAHLKKGGQLIYRSGALITTGRRPN